MKKRILITGGAGFIGSHLCKRLLDQENEVICLDNFFTGRKENIIGLLGNPYFEIIRHDVCLPNFLEVDQIYNLACPASPVSYQRDPVQTVKVSVMGVINMVGMAKRLGIPILQASTSEIYGDPITHPQSESYWGNVNCNGPRSCYDEGKRCAETLLCDYHRQHNVQIRIARIFNTYGPHMDMGDGRVVSNFIVQALKGEDITIYGTGEQTRSFCYVDDTVDALIRLMNSDAPEATTPVNVGNPSERTMRELAEYVVEVTESDSTIIFMERPEDDPNQRCPDIEKAHRLLKWKPNTTFEVGIEKSIAYFRGQLNRR